MEKISYALGISLGHNLKNSGFEELSYQKLSDGIRDVMKGDKLEMSIQEAQGLINDYFQKLQEKAYEQNIEEGKSFLAENARRPEVKTTASGLQYEILTEGKGNTPKASDRVQVHYHGTLINGNVFDSSVSRGEPATFGVTQVIQGWVEALQLMPVGSKWKLYIPSELAYGAQGAGQSIGPHTTLVFEVELLAIV
ncbi:MAG: FKBP-type peptidyl-prolyl cis-trans isomerase [Paludibacter sp.]|nr:FKBP-type peptidyl-prolyl cis-trans isomerase [Paludibacter sp.]